MMSAATMTLFDYQDVNIAEHYVSALINGDYTGLSDAEEHMLDAWYEHNTAPYTDGDERTWTFNHIDTPAFDGEFTLDDVSDQYATCAAVRLIFASTQ